MAERIPEGIEIGIHLLAENGNSGVMVLFGNSTPGGLGDFDDVAEIGSLFITTDGRLLQKNLSNGNPADWERKADRSEIYDIAEIDVLLAPKVNYSDIVANIVTNDDNLPLSASQGVALQLNLTNAITALKGGVSASNDTLKKLEDNANTFRNRTDNPHMVTKAQLSLGVVENKTSQDIRDEIVDSDIPSTIARDSEVTTAVAGGVTLLRDGVPTDGDTLNKLNNKILSILDTLAVDDTTLDTLQEIVDFIKDNRQDLDDVLLQKVAYTDIVDNVLSTDGSTKVLSANQGRVLDLLIKQRMIGSANLSELTNLVSARSNLEVMSITQVNQAITDSLYSASDIKTLYESNPQTNEFSDIEKSKLGLIENEATKNQTDAFLVARANHTGTQLSATISDLIATITNHPDVALNTTHRGRSDNPHSVTKTQVGLSNVTNDAQLKIASNLSDVANIVTSRENLAIYHLHRIAQYTNTDTTTDLNASPLNFVTLVPIFGNEEELHSDFTLNSATRMTANFTGKVRIESSIYVNIADDFQLETRMLIGASLVGPIGVAGTGNHGGAGSGAVQIAYDYNITSGQIIELRSRREGRNDVIPMDTVGTSFIKLTRLT